MLVEVGKLRASDKYLAAAVEGRAAFVVTGDPDLLDMEEYDSVRIVSPRQFLDLPDQEGASERESE